MPWVLNLDCDEELSGDLKAAIIAFFQNRFAGGQD